MGHTPKPWKILRGLAQTSIYSDEAPIESELICTLRGLEHWRELDSSNANLIVAAPYMLEILERIAIDPEGDIGRGLSDQVEHVIALAYGKMTFTEFQGRS